MALPVIPLMITVHLGSPKTNARNIRISFRDYVKNVACSEIYPTWPENALRANIYVITTFALNRVYTEFYRAQGYAFDITSSTSYDQAFVEGRDIFANISRLVDEQFNDYIVRRGQVQPMFSQYCNGTTVTCKGLSQWGSYYLATQGYTPLRILQYYYGSDIDIVFNTPQTNIRESYPNRLLMRGSIGESVRTLQKMLRRISQNYPAIPKAEVNAGIFDAATEQAVLGFQKVFGLTADGIAGRQTWYRVVSIYNAVKRLSELNAEGISASEAQELYPSSVTQGSVGFSVRLVQYLLNFIAKFHPSIPRLDPDGVYGPLTRQAVLAFQRLNGLAEDGIVGRDTFNRLLASYEELYARAPASVVRDDYPGRALVPGDSGDKVRQLQLWINALADRVSSIPYVIVDGIYGGVTREAVSAFQRYVQLPVSGEVDPVTWYSLAERVT
ncbi:MAG: peptidoglycan-binding protein [Oscillospiraceae bacterium]|nr:peptidoglycan-binding protein [Oscillospiraceae bacterium]